MRPPLLDLAIVANSFVTGQSSTVEMHIRDAELVAELDSSDHISVGRPPTNRIKPKCEKDKGKTPCHSWKPRVTGTTFGKMATPAEAAESLKVETSHAPTILRSWYAWRNQPESDEQFDERRTRKSRVVIMQ